MARLFVAPRDLNFISDVSKEIIKDVIGQRVFLYPISETRTQTHGVYSEAQRKVYDNPIELDAIIDASYQAETKTDKFGVDAQYKLEVFLQYRDLVDKGINVSIGDFFSFSDVYYEISDVTVLKNIYGMPEHRGGVKIVGLRAREGAFKAPLIGPTDIAYTDADAVQTTFVQQRGYPTLPDGSATGDKRDLRENQVLEEPLTGQKEVSPRGDATGAGPAFYDE